MLGPRLHLNAESTLSTHHPKEESTFTTSCRTKPPTSTLRVDRSPGRIRGSWWAAREGRPRMPQRSDCGRCLRWGGVAKAFDHDADVGTQRTSVAECSTLRCPSSGGFTRVGGVPRVMPLLHPPSAPNASPVRRLRVLPFNSERSSGYRTGGASEPDLAPSHGIGGGSCVQLGCPAFALGPGVPFGARVKSAGVDAQTAASLLEQPVEQLGRNRVRVIAHLDPVE